MLRHGQTTKDEWRQASGRLESVDAALLGVVINMFQGRSEASLEAFHALTSSDAAPLFETTIPRSDAFAEACLSGVPVRFVQRRGQAPPVSWLFDMLATEVCDRTWIGGRGDDHAIGSFVA